MKFDPEVRSAVAYWSPRLGVAIDPTLVHAVIQKESSHGLVDTTQESRGRVSYGPMMVLDTTAAGYGINDPTALKDPATGIWWGVRYLGDMLVRFPGDMPRAVSAYNAGAGGAARSGTTGKFPNQSYVDSVLGWWRLYGGGGVGLAAAIVGVTVGTFLLLRALAGARRTR
jgi:soluble lytic murein transglycosylase-like protein